jgi:hypothetical protein
MDLGVLAFLERYDRQEHFLLLSSTLTLEESTQSFYEELLASAGVVYDELKLLDAILLMPELI